jgi:hypothetical protein
MDPYLNMRQTTRKVLMARSSKSAQPPRKANDPEQSRAFLEKAREIGADEKHSAADKLMERLAKTKPEPRKTK